MLGGPWRWWLLAAAAFQLLSVGLLAADDEPWTVLRVVMAGLQLLIVPLALLWPWEMRRVHRRAERAEHLNLGGIP